MSKRKLNYTVFNSLLNQNDYKLNNFYLIVHVNDSSDLDASFISNLCYQNKIKIFKVKLTLIEKLKKNINNHLLSQCNGPTSIILFENINSYLTFINNPFVKKKIIPLSIFVNNKFIPFKHFNNFIKTKFNNYNKNLSANSVCKNFISNINTLSNRINNFIYLINKISEKKSN